MEDSKIIALFFARNEAAIAETDLAYGKRLRGLSYRIVGSREDAEENVNDTYWKAWNAIPPERPKHYFGFLASICRHLSLDRLDWNNAGKRKSEVISLTQELEGCIPSPESRWEQDALGEALNAFLHTLPRENRVIFLRRYWFGDSLGEIARRCGLRESAVQMRLNRMRKKLRSFLEKEGVFL